MGRVTIFLLAENSKCADIYDKINAIHHMSVLQSDKSPQCWWCQNPANGKYIAKALRPAVQIFVLEHYLVMNPTN